MEGAPAALQEINQQGAAAVLEEISRRLQKDGVPSDASPEQRLCHLWEELVRREAELLSSSAELQTVRTQQASEMKEVENYVEHIRNLLEERESLTSEYERENDQLRGELGQLKQQLDVQRKEVVEMLEQEGLGEIGQSSSSEQVAYMLVERATLLERLEAAERKLDTQTLTGSLREVHLQEELDHIRNTMAEELRQQQESVQRTKDNMSKDPQGHSPWRKLFGMRKEAQRAHASANAHGEEVLKQREERVRLERDLEEASRRLTMAHEEIRHLTDQLDSSSRKHNNNNNNPAPNAADVIEGQGQEATEKNERLSEEIRVLRERIHILDTERKDLLEMVEKAKSDNHGPEKSSDRSPRNLGQAGDTDEVHAQSSDNQEVHKRCRREWEDQECRLREVQRRLVKLQGEHEELVERNEELEALLGEEQNCSRQEQDRHEGEVEGLRRKIKSLETEASQRESLMASTSTEEGSGSSQHGEMSGERVTFLQGRLEEEKTWRKQLETDLITAQTSLRKEKETLQRNQEELASLNSEVQSLRAECQQAKALNLALGRVRGEKEVLEDKVAQLERAHGRLKSELSSQVENSSAHKDLQESRGQVAELTAQLEKQRAQLTSLEKEHTRLKNEMTERSRQVLELQGELSKEAQLRLQAEGERQRLGLELQHLRDQQQQHQQHKQQQQQQEGGGRQEQVCLEGRRPKPEGEPWPRPAFGDGPHEQGGSQLTCLKLEMSRLQCRLEEEREVARQHQLALQAQVNQAHARSKSQDSVLQQKTEESKQLKQDLVRTQTLFTSAERELRYEREKNLDLKKHNALLDQEKLKVSAELRQALAKLSQVEQSDRGRGLEVERLQQRSRELELQLARTSQSRHSTSSLQEELCAERSRLIAADKKVLELQQQLKSSLHQLRLEEARSGETSKLERESRDLADSLSALRAQHHEEQLQRKLVEQREEELQQQLRSLRTKEAALSRSASELTQRLQQSETRLHVLETEHAAAKQELRVLQQECVALRQQLASSQQDCERLQEELTQAMKHLDSHIRKYNEKQCQYKSRLYKAKQVYTRATSQRDRTIQKLHSDVILANGLSEREQERVRQVTVENEKLLLERRELLQRVAEAEEALSNGLRSANTAQHRVSILEVENRQLQEKTLRLAHQVGTLERGLRTAHTTCSLEDLKKVIPADSDVLLQTPGSSPKPGLGDPLSLLESIRRVKVVDHLDSLRSSLSVAFPQPSDLSYLNVTSPDGAQSSPAGQEENNNINNTATEDT
ncbi:trichohyalin [Engraulis encrasicolus]|uniref:trichohyalin n=1 Tax=Engraulis encrasicolus TaxID=184585 RepID=UPI002FD1EF34